MHHRVLKDCAILIGYSPEGQCVYSAQMPLSDYWDGEHVWDSDTGVQDLRLERVRGYLFDETGFRNLRASLILTPASIDPAG